MASVLTLLPMIGVISLSCIPNKAELVLKMIKIYMLLDRDGSSTSRNKMVKEFEASRFF